MAYMTAITWQLHKHYGELTGCHQQQRQLLGRDD